MKYVVCMLALLLLPLGAGAADGALYMQPERGAYKIGELFEVKILADSGGVPINAVEAELQFNTAALEVENITAENSILSTWSTEPYFSNTDGLIRFSGWAGHSFTGDDGLLLTVTFKALRNAAANTHLAAGAMLAVQDGSNIITSMKSGVYTVAPREETTPAIPKTDVSEDVPIISSPVSPPKFTIYEHSIRAGERIVVQGTTEASSRLIIWLQKGSEETMHESISDADGSFTFTFPRPAEEGVYRIWAAVVDPYGAPGPQSERILVNVRSSGIAASVVPSEEVVSATLPYIAFVVFAGILIGYFIHRRSLYHRTQYHG